MSVNRTDNAGPVLMGRLEWIQALRAIASLFVFLFHLTPHFEGLPVLNSISNLSQWGFFGVDVFFVLSGFVIFKSAQKDIPADGVVYFLLKRVVRIGSGFWPVFLIYSAYLILINKVSFDSIRFFGSLFLILPFPDDNYLSVAWSLSYELYFYVLIGFLVCAGRKYFDGLVSLFLLGVVLFNYIPFLLHRGAFLIGDIRPAFFVSAFCLEFFSGVLICNLLEKGVVNLSRAFIPAVAATAFVLAGFCLGAMSPLFNTVNALRVFSYGLMGVGILLLGLWLQANVKSPPRWLILLGDASFSLYLIHVPFLDISGMIRWKIITRYGGNYGAVFVAFSALLILLISVVWYLSVERPIHSTLSKILLSRKKFRHPVRPQQ